MKEISELQSILDKNDIDFMLDAENSTSFPHLNGLEMKISGERYKFYIEDEYNDLASGNKLLLLCLVFYEIEDYMEEDDILSWSKTKNLSVEEPDVIDYYREFAKIINKLSSKLGTIVCPVSSFDYQMNSGAIQILRSQGKIP